MMKRRISEYPACERPYERCMKYGPGTLSDAELLAVILRSGTRGCDVKSLAGKVLEAFGGDISGICHADLTTLKGIDGIGSVKAVQILCLAQIAKRIWKEDNDKSSRILHVKEAADYYMQDLRYLETEHVYVLMLDTKMRRIGEYHASKGGVNMSVVPVREIIREALKCNAVNIIMVHNHPSGDATPSGCDTEVSLRLRDACELSGIRFIDSIIIGDGKYYSFREEGQLI